MTEYFFYWYYNKDHPQPSMDCVVKFESGETSGTFGFFGDGRCEHYFGWSRSLCESHCFRYPNRIKKISEDQAMAFFRDHRYPGDVPPELEEL